MHADPNFDRLVQLGQWYARISRAEPRELELSLLRSWVMEEGDELRLALVRRDQRAQLDALFDLLGLVFLGLSLYPNRHRRDALAEYERAQTERGRPLSWWVRLIRSALWRMAAVGQVSARRALYAKLAKRLLTAARAHPAASDVLAHWPEDEAATASACLDATPPITAALDRQAPVTLDPRCWAVPSTHA